MPSDPTERRLAAIMFTDIVGYTALMAESEERGLRVRERHRELLRPLVERYRGEWIEETGDESLSSFQSVVDAVNCALAAQAELREDPELRLRIGIHLGETLVEGGRVYGDGVNIASRIRPLAEPGGICVSAEVQQAVRNQPNVECEPLGERELKNVGRPVSVFSVRGTPHTAAPREAEPVASAGRRSGRRALAWLGSVALVAAAGVWLSWPAVLGLLLDRAGLGGPPVDPPVPDKPSIVVLPFDNMSGDPEQEYFSDGITEDLTTDLASIPELFVIARNSAFTYKGRAVNVADVGRELGVRYVLEGSVRRAGGRVRITAQLIDATTGFHLWSERYDRDLSDVFAVQSEISREILTALKVELRDAAFERMGRRSTDDLEAYDLFLRAISHYQRFYRDDNLEARRLFERALERDPDFAVAHAFLGGTYLSEYMNGWRLDPNLMDLAEQRERRALELDPELPPGFALLATVELYRGRLVEAAAAAERAVELAPSLDPPHLVLAMVRVQQNRLAGAMRLMERALRLNPRTWSPSLVIVGWVNFRAGRTERAIELWEGVRAANPDMIVARLPLAAIYESQGRHAEATELVQEILRVNPAFTVEAASDLFAMQISEEIRANLRNAGLR
jgi:adenylate cyclase